MSDTITGYILSSEVTGEVHPISVCGGVADFTVTGPIVAGVSWDTVEFYVDGSLAKRDSSISDLYVKLGSAGVSQIYVDSSLSQRDASINNLYNTTLKTGDLAPYATNSSVGTALNPFATNASVGTAIQNFSTNASVNTALGVFATNASINTAAFAKNASFNLYTTNASVGLAIAPFATNASVGLSLSKFILSASTGTGLYWNAGYLNASTGGGGGIGDVTKVYVDGSLASRDTSIAWLNTNKLESIALNPYATNASINTAAFAKNASLSSYSLTTHNHQGLYLKEASLGSSFLWNGGKVDVSLAGGGVTQSYVDNADNLIKATYIPNASLNKSYFRWVNNLLEPSIATGSSGVTQSYVDGSLGLRDTSIAWLNTNKLGSADLNPYATNASIGTAAFAKNASFNLYATNASIGTAAFVQGTPWTGMGYVTGTPWTGLGYATVTNVNASLNLFATNSSIGTAIAPFATNASVGLAIAPFATNSSVGLAIQNFATNASIGTAAFAKNASLGLYATNASIGLAGFENKVDVDTSLNSIWTNFDLYATNASINTAGFENKIDVDTSFGLYATNASIGTAAFAKNASLALYELATNVDTSFGLYSTTTQINTQFGYRDTSITGIWTKLGNVDTSLNNIGTGGGGGGASSIATLTDVSLGTIANNTVLQYDTSISKWENVSPIEISTYCYSQSQSDALYNPKRLVATLAASDVTSGTTENIMLQLAIPAARAISGSTFRAWVVGNSSSTGTLIFKVRCGAGGTITDTIDWTAVTSAAQVANATAGFEVIITIRSATTIAVRGVGYAGTVQLPTVVAAPTTPAIDISGDWHINLTVICSSGTFTAQVGLIEEII